MVSVLRILNFPGATVGVVVKIPFDYFNKNCHVKCDRPLASLDFLTNMDIAIFPLRIITLCIT